MKIFVGGIATETNTFAPSPTGMAAYEEQGIRHRNGGTAPHIVQPSLDFLISTAAAEGHEIAWGLIAWAIPSGPTRQDVWEALRDELLDDLRAQMPVDAVILPLHGAMVAEACLDCEGELIERVRQIVGPDVPIGVELDLHCHFTAPMMQGNVITIAYKEYPHIDMVDRLAELWKLTLAAARGEVHPVTAAFDVRMINFWHTTREPMVSFVKRMKAIEQQPGVLSVSFGHGFPYGDTPATTAQVWVVTDGDRPLAARLAEELGREIFAMRDQTAVPPVPLDTTLDRMLAVAGKGEGQGKPVVVADRSDNAGGGAASDSTFILRRLIERGIGNVAIGGFFDLGAIHTCREAGVGARLKLRVGGKTSPQSGEPVDLQVTVRNIVADHHQTGMVGDTLGCGPSVWVSTDDGLDLALISVRHQAFGTDLFTGLGIALSGKLAVVVKSSQHFHAAFAPIAAAVLYADTPGAMRSDFENMSYTHRDGNFWPRVQDPWAKAD